MNSFICTDLNPCLNVHCPRFGICKTYSAHDARCECDDQCPSYQDPVCTANGTTYDNKCWHELSYCRGLENNLVYHPGSCEGKRCQNSLKAQISSVWNHFNSVLADTIFWPPGLVGEVMWSANYRHNLFMGISWSHITFAFLASATQAMFSVYLFWYKLEI